MRNQKDRRDVGPFGSASHCQIDCLDRNARIIRHEPAAGAGMVADCPMHTARTVRTITEVYGPETLPMRMVCGKQRIDTCISTMVYAIITESELLPTISCS
jgi:hypothetical protein